MDYGNGATDGNALTLTAGKRLGQRSDIASVAEFRRRRERGGQFPACFHPAIRMPKAMLS